MKLLIASDVHGSALYLGKLMDRISGVNPDKVLLLGDLLYHGPRNDLPEGYNPKKCIELYNSINEKFVCVRGNCDAEVDQMVLNFPIMADYMLIDLDGKQCYATHGHHINPASPFPGSKNYILMNGHTHIPAWDVHENFLYVNPGSISIPKEGSCHSYMIYNDGILQWIDLETNQVYHSLKL